MVFSFMYDKLLKKFGGIVVKELFSIQRSLADLSPLFLFTLLCLLLVLPVCD